MKHPFIPLIALALCVCGASQSQTFPDTFDNKRRLSLEVGDAWEDHPFDFPHRNPTPAAFHEAQQDTSAQRKGRWVFLPILFSSPDTKLGVGILPQYIFYTSPRSRPSRARADAFYTQRKQFNIQVTPAFWLHEDKYRLASKVVFTKWPTMFYGIGPHSSKEHKEPYTEYLFSLSVDVQRQTHPHLFAGLGYTLRRGSISNVDPEGILASEALVGSGRGTASGVGLGISWDTRDHVFYPSSGSLYQFSASFFGPVLGSAYRFSSFELDLRQYYSLFSSHVLALQAAVKLTPGQPPFRMLPGVGEVLRGYASARYIDKTMLALQMEYRVVPVWWRIGLVAFAGVGEVAPRITAFNFRQPKYVVGLGIRFLVYRNEKIAVRWDYSLGRGSSGDYLDLSEAF